jgi:hypothetical protein
MSQSLFQPYANKSKLQINIEILAALSSPQLIVMIRLLNAADKRGRILISSVQPFIVGHPITVAEGEAALTALEHRALIRPLRKTKHRGHYQLSDRIFGGFVNGEG